MDNKAEPRLEDQSQPQQERLFYLEFRLYFLGHANRSDLQLRFGLKESSASRDIALYKKLVPNNVVYDYGIKSYVPQPSFVPLFAYTGTQVLTALTHGFGDDYAGPKFPEISSEAPSQAPLPFIPTLAAITRAIHKEKSLTVNYYSEEVGEKVSTIVPHSLIDSGNRWSLRAYNRGAERFEDFVINRITDVQDCNDEPTVDEQKDADVLWNQIIELNLKPHPSLAHPKAVEREYGMRGGVLKMTCRAALRSYLLRQWRVDTATSPATAGQGYQLWLDQ
ncbi:WYL domain-containing protein [Reinekea sp.]|jgi:hypothetical protein|uniref:WYL domain-containing protein n=1 Tax=Reinekea sp. TaxID=1970455 RepID=UPI003988FF67